MAGNWSLLVGDETYVFGNHDEAVSFITAPEISTDLTTDDRDNSGMDGRTFGVDVFPGATVAFELALRADSESEVRALLAGLRGLWRGDAARFTPGAVAMLTAHTGRVAFGRPRRFSPVEEWAPDGRIDVVSDFSTSDDLWYSGEEFSSSVALVPEAGGGLVFPAVSPFVFQAAAVPRRSGFTVGGDVDTWGVYTIHGPITNPTVEVVGAFSLSYSGSLAYDQALVIDTRPFARTVLLDGAGAALTGASSRLADTALSPGSYELVLRGTSTEGTASASVVWRDAYTTY